MKSISKLFLTGLVAILPMFATLYILYWLGSAAETRLGALIQVIVPEQYYWTGMGLIAGMGLVLLIGVLMNAVLFRSLIAWGEERFAKLPLIKTLYGSIRDLMKFASSTKGKQLGHVVTVKIGEPDIFVLGFLTNDNVGFIDKNLRQDLVAVYLPMSYQIGGYTILVPRSAVRPSDLPMNEAMRFTITAGMVTGDNNKGPANKDAP